MTPTIHEVAKHAGVSAMTVSRVINGSPRVSPETRQRVERAITELGYVPNGLAQGFSRQRSSTLALLMPDISNPFFGLIVRGATSVARQAGYRIILCNTEEEQSYEQMYTQDMLAHRVEGLLFIPASDRSRSTVRLIEQRTVPLVLIDSTIEGCKCDVVQGDSVGGAEQLVTHLIAQGHRRIGMLGGPAGVSTARDRLQGYRHALTRAGLPYEAALVVEDDYQQAAGYRGMQQLLQLAAPPTAVFAANNFIGVGAIVALRERGMAVPDHMALVCFDDIEYAALLYPLLTVMAQPAETFGTIATQLLLEQIAGRDLKRPRQVMLAPELIVRRSCGMRSEPAPA